MWVNFAHTFSNFLYFIARWDSIVPASPFVNLAKMESFISSENSSLSSSFSIMAQNCGQCVGFLSKFSMVSNRNFGFRTSPIVVFSFLASFSCFRAFFRLVAWTSGWFPSLSEKVRLLGERFSLNFSLYLFPGGSPSVVLSYTSTGRPGTSGGAVTPPGSTGSWIRRLLPIQ